MRPGRTLPPAALLLVLAACVQAPPELPEPPELPVAEVHRSWWREGERLRRRWEVHRHPDGRVVMHGPETEWFEDGALAAERAWREGEPAGTWRTWYPSGAPRSLVEIGAGTELLPMRFWHESGAVAGEGTGLAGVREGLWTYRRPDGSREREGAFRRGLRHGPWTFWDEAGRTTAEGLYEDGQRVGTWKLWDAAGVLHLREHAPDRPRPGRPGDPGETSGAGGRSRLSRRGESELAPRGMDRGLGPALLRAPAAALRLAQ